MLYVASRRTLASEFKDRKLKGSHAYENSCFCVPIDGSFCSKLPASVIYRYLAPRGGDLPMKKGRRVRGTCTVPCNTLSRGSICWTFALVFASMSFRSGDAQDLSKCDATVDYTASLGPGGVNNGSRTFGGSVGIVNLSKVGSLACDHI